MTQPAQPKIYHIVHVDRLPSILAATELLSDATVVAKVLGGTTVGMNHIKERRLNDLTLQSHPELHVGDCVPFYFCPRSIMLYIIDRGNNPDLAYQGGQEPIIHIEADLYETVAWAEAQNLRWAFTLSNAGAYYFEDRADLNALSEIDWAAVNARNWVNCKEGKQAEFLIEKGFPWSLVQRIGVYSNRLYTQVANIIQGEAHRPQVILQPDWYY